MPSEFSVQIDFKNSSLGAGVVLSGKKKEGVRENFFLQEYSRVID